MFPSDPHRRQGYHLVVLLLRAAIVLVLAFLLFRPFFSSASNPHRFGPTPRRQLILIDTSASMRQHMLWHAAVMTVLAELHRARPDDTVALYTFDEEIVPLLSFAEWSDTPVRARIGAAFQRLASVEPGWGGTELGAALVKAAHALATADASSSNFRKQILVISDNRTARAIGGLESEAWPADIELVVKPLQADETPEDGLRVVERRAPRSRALATAE